MGRSWRRALITVAVVLAVAVAAGWPLYVNPAVDSASTDDPADAIVVLGGEPQAASFGLRLLNDGDARDLVLSNPYGPPPWGDLSSLCPDRPAPRVTCFAPDPSTTRGEARQIGRLAAQNGWDDVIVVAPTFHISRARMIVKRCYPGRLRMVEYRPNRPLLWPYHYVYQTFGFAKAGVLRGC